MCGCEAFRLKECEENLIIYLTFLLIFIRFLLRVKKTSRRVAKREMNKISVRLRKIIHPMKLVISLHPFSHAFNSNNSTVCVVDDAGLRRENTIQHAINIIYALIILPQDTKTF